MYNSDADSIYTSHDLTSDLSQGVTGRSGINYDGGFPGYYPINIHGFGVAKDSAEAEKFSDGSIVNFLLTSEIQIYE